MTGLFVTIEGVEGCGKTTQLRLLREHLQSHGHNVVQTREPGGPPIAEAIRDILLDPANAALSPTAELLLYEAARAQHVDERIRPALKAGAIVVCDRFADSTTAYQGAARGLPADVVRRLHEIATRGTWPDLTIVLDLPAEEGLRRAAAIAKPDRLESEPLQFHERVRQGFLEVARNEPNRVRVVDGTRSVEVIAHEIAALIDAMVGKA